MSKLHRLYSRRLAAKNAKRIVYARRKKDKATVSSIAAFNSDGKLLFGLRNDTEKWTLPGGHAEEGEDPRDAAIRELKEETGLDAGDLEYLGDGYGGRDKNIHVFCYKTTVSGEPTVGQDPDDECSVWSWVDAEGEIPAIILDNLHNRKNITLDLLGKLEKKADVNIVDEPHDDLMDLDDSAEYPAGDLIHTPSSYHPEDSQRHREGQKTLSDLTTTYGGSSTDSLSSLSNNGENTNEDVDVKLGEVEAPYSSGSGPLAVGTDDDKKYNIMRGASLKMADLIRESKELSPEYGYQFSVETTPTGNSAITKVTVTSKDGEQVAAANFVHQGNNIVPGYVVVDDDHQRRGIASAMYKYVEQQTGKKIVRSTNQTPEGAALWDQNNNRGFGEQTAVALPDQGVDENKYEDDLTRSDNSISRDPLNEGPIYGR